MEAGSSWTVLGAGTATPHPSRTSSGHLLTCGDTRVLIDMGAGTLWRLAAAGVDWADLDAVVLSHAHLDHTLDLQAMMFAANVPGHGRTRPLPIVLHPRCRVVLDRIAGALGKWFVPKGFDVKWVEIDEGQVEVGPVSLTLGPVQHHESSIGVRAEAGGVTWAYSGDSDHCEPLEALCAGADMAIVECSTPDASKAPGHMAPAEVAALAAGAELDAIALVHMYPSCDEVDLKAALRHHGYAGQVTVCQDGQRLAPPAR